MLDHQTNPAFFALPATHWTWTSQGSYRHRRELWIVMEYCGGGSASDLVAATGEPLPEDTIAYVCGEALKVKQGAAWGRVG